MQVSLPPSPLMPHTPGYQAQSRPSRADGSTLASECWAGSEDRAISFVRLPAQVDKRTPPAAPVSEAGTLINTLGEWVLNAGAPFLGWNVSLSLTDPEAKMPSGRHTRLTLVENLISLCVCLSDQIIAPQGVDCSGLRLCAQDQHSTCTEEMLRVPSVTHNRG